VTHFILFCPCVSYLKILQHYLILQIIKYPAIYVHGRISYLKGNTAIANQH